MAFLFRIAKYLFPQVVITVNGVQSTLVDSLGNTIVLNGNAQ